jgi:hypothetical protein
MKYWFKQCPKCHGDLRIEQDEYGEYVACMQCGNTLKQAEELWLRRTGALSPGVMREPALR